MIAPCSRPSVSRISLFGPKLQRIAFFLTLVLLSARTSVQAQSSGTAPAIAESADAFSDVLSLARTSVQKMFEDIAGLSCTETVTQSILDRFNRSMYEEHSVFNYRLEADGGDTSLHFAESRDVVQAPFRDPGRNLLMTDGFGSMLLVLHPAYMASFRFEAEGVENVAGTQTVKFRFQEIPGAASLLMIRVAGRRYSVALRGTVWIERQRGVVMRLISRADAGTKEFGIQSIVSEILYAPRDLESSGDTYWLPASAVIDVETAKHHWQNVHHFAAYKQLQLSARP